MAKKTSSNTTTMTKAISEEEPRYFTGIAYYFFATHADTKFNPEGRFKLNLITDPESTELARECGITVNPAKENIPGEWITASSRFAPNLYDSEMNKIEGKLVVGNGSRVRIRATPIKFAKGIGLRLHSAQILTLVPYEPKDKAVVGGFTRGTEGDFRIEENAAEATDF